MDDKHLEKAVHEQDNDQTKKDVQFQPQPGKPSFFSPKIIKFADKLLPSLSENKQPPQYKPSENPADIAFIELK